MEGIIDYKYLMKQILYHLYNTKNGRVERSQRNYAVVPKCGKITYMYVAAAHFIAAVTTFKESYCKTCE